MSHPSRLWTINNRNITFQWSIWDLLGLSIIGIMQDVPIAFKLMSSASITFNLLRNLSPFVETSTVRAKSCCLYTSSLSPFCIHHRSHDVFYAHFYVPGHRIKWVALLETCPIKEQYRGVDGPSQNKGDWKSPREKVGGGCLCRQGWWALRLGDTVEKTEESKI